MESYSRVRSVKLKRPGPDHPFGFSVRGGHEHGTGIFVSFVDPRSTAYRQGLKVGDQILRVNGFPVSAAVHHECLSLMKIRTSLHLKVRSVGMLPVKEKHGDPLTWKLVEEQPLPDLPDRGISRTLATNSRMSDTSSQPDSRTDFQSVETKVIIDISGHSGLGCCICKGPPERPGIFVQSTKSNGVAREAGLRPGDQVLACNGHSFLHIPFAEAVYYLKSSKQLNLRVLKGAASDLFPGESSGYNSSASSLNGDAQLSSNPPSESSSPAIGNPADILLHEQEQPNKRLSMVTEENSTIEETDRRTAGKRNLSLDRNMERDEGEKVWRAVEKETIVIEVKGEDPVEKLRSEEERLQEERRKLEETQKRLLEEALQLEEEKRKFEEEKRRSLRKSPSIVSNSSSSTESGNSLAGALNQEILKRTERRGSTLQSKDDEQPKPGTVEQKRSLFSTQIDHEKRQQHDQLIEEFKRAHRKMFAHTLTEESQEVNGDESTEGEISARNRRIQKEIDHGRQMVAQRVAGIVRQRQLRIERQHQEVAETEREVSVILNKTPPPPPPLPPSSSGENNTPNSVKGSTKPQAPSPNPKMLQKPQPPPPSREKMVIIEEKPSAPHSNHQQHVLTPTKNSTRHKGQAPPPPPPQRSESTTVKNNINTSTKTNAVNIPSVNGNSNSASTANVNGNGTRPASPSPDYSNSPSPTPSPPRNRQRQIAVDMQSLESFRLKDPPRSVRKPPPVYFCESGQQGLFPGNIKFAAYPSTYNRPEPSRLEFVQKSGNNMGNGGPNNKTPTELILPKELEEALARCNLVNGEVTRNGNGKVTIVLGESNANGGGGCSNNNANNMMTSRQQNNIAIGKPNGGGILKLGNGHGTTSTPKTISFVGKH